MKHSSYWRSPEELITLGFERSPIVMMNEAHSGLQRCVRTREIGRRILPAAHEAGVRHLAMEALGPHTFADDANRLRHVPDAPDAGYLAQPEMRLYIQAALDLGWTLVPYEADYEAHPAAFKKAESINWEEEQQTPGLSDAATETISWREEQQARNLCNALDALPPGTELLVWCGNSHHSKERNDWFAPMGFWFRELSGIDFFGIDQCVTADFGHSAVHRWVLGWPRNSQRIWRRAAARRGFLRKTRRFRTCVTARTRTRSYYPLIMSWSETYITFFAPSLRAPQRR